MFREAAKKLNCDDREFDLDDKNFSIRRGGVIEVELADKHVWQTFTLKFDMFSQCFFKKYFSTLFSTINRSGQGHTPLSLPIRLN